MRIEHVALNVSDPPGMAAWYAEHLRMKVVRHRRGAVEAFFIADGTGNTLLEIYRNPPDQVPDYPRQDPLQLHLAFCSEDVAGDYTRLLAAGATAVDPPERLPTGDLLAMVRDPWGLPLQLVQRAEPMV
ncbi:MAG: VOC family protein [Armatimonadota bacterium]|nr:VOC family protein [Armatimonadota bacterium]